MKQLFGRQRPLPKTCAFPLEGAGLLKCLILIWLIQSWETLPWSGWLSSVGGSSVDGSSGGCWQKQIFTGLSRHFHYTQNDYRPENPPRLDCGKERRIWPFSGDSRESRDFRDSRDSCSEKTPFVMTSFAGPNFVGRKSLIADTDYTQNDYWTELYYFIIIFGNSCSVITELTCFWNCLVSIRSVSKG